MAFKKVLLVKCHRNTIFSYLEPIVTEPLELEYLGAVLNKLSIEYRIYDQILEGKSFKGIFKCYQPDLLVLSGYITAVNVIKEFASYAKKRNPNIKVIVGGVHAEINYEDFFMKSIDVIVHSDGINTFKNLMESSFSYEELSNIHGIAFSTGTDFKLNEKLHTEMGNVTLPDRSYFNSYKHKTKYLNYGPLAIVKSALSCPFICNFCFCKLLNLGLYSSRQIETVVEEISKIDCEYIWIVDDSFLLDRKRLERFIELVKMKKVHKKFIAYSRADFIADNEDLIEKLTQIGFVDLIVGMEAIEDYHLLGFNKNVRSDDNMKAAEIVSRYGITLTALFIADIDFTVKDFKNLRNWIKSMNLKQYTISIFTPIKGVKDYKNYKDKLITVDPSKWDFLHLVIRPTNMSITGFYVQFYISNIMQFFINKEIRKYIFKRFKKLFSLGGHDV